VTTIVPVVDYLVPDEATPHLLARVCDSCGAQYLERRNGCGRCGGRQFSRRPAPRAGTVMNYTVVWRSHPGVEVPFVSCLVDLGDGLVVKSNLVGVDPTTVDRTVLGRPVQLVTSDLPIDAKGTRARSFAFEVQAEGSGR
jgi:uncharacterized protein